MGFELLEVLSLDSWLNPNIGATCVYPLSNALPTFRVKAWRGCVSPQSIFRWTRMMVVSYYDDITVNEAGLALSVASDCWLGS